MIHQFRRANTIGLSPARSSSASNANSKSPTYLQVKQLKMKATIDNSRMNFVCGWAEFDMEYGRIFYTLR